MPRHNYVACSPYQPVYYSSQHQGYTPPAVHQPTDVAVSEPSADCSDTYSSIITFTVPEGQLANINYTGRWSNGSYIDSNNPWNASVTPNTTSINNSAIHLIRNGNQVTIGVRRGFTGTFTIGNRTINSNEVQPAQPVVPELQAPINGGSTAPITDTPSTPPASTDPIQRILDGLSVSTPQENQRGTYGGVIEFDAPVGTVSIRYESEAGNGNFSFSRRHCGGPLEANANGVAYIQASPNAYRQVGSGCGSYLIPTQNHFGVGIDPNFRGTIIVSINGRERRIPYPPPTTITPPTNLQSAIPAQPLIPELADPIRPGEFTPVNPTDIPILATSNTLAVPAVNSLSIPTAITNFTALQNSFPSTLERGTHWANTDSREQRRAIANFMRNYATAIATSIRPDGPQIRVGDRMLSPAAAREYFQGLSEQYRGIYNSYGL